MNINLTITDKHTRIQMTTEKLEDCLLFLHNYRKIQEIEESLQENAVSLKRWCTENKELFISCDLNEFFLTTQHELKEKGIIKRTSRYMTTLRTYRNTLLKDSV